MKIYLAADHAGYELKETLKSFLSGLGHEVSDKGAFSLDDGDDYLDFVRPCAEAVARDAESFGIVLGASGQGEAMCANRVKGIRAAVYYGPAAHPQTDESGAVLDIIASERMHNDANILSLGARFITPEDAQAVAKRFVETPFSNAERHVRRIAKLDN